MMRPLYKPRTRDEVASRGWLFLGEQGGPCDKACEMCYYAFQKNLVFYSQETLFQHANLFRHYYDLDAVDITGGEPTIMKGLPALVKHCTNIGLDTTIITHGQNTNDAFFQRVHGMTVAEFEQGGLTDYLVSLHGDTPASHDAVLGSPGSYDRLANNLGNISRPARFNTTLMTTNVDDLPVSTLLKQKPTVWNLINFNPFHAWSIKKDIDFQVPVSESAPKVAAAVHALEAEGWEVNVRYWPMCLAEEHGFARNVSGYHQVPFDPWEWRLNATARTPMEVIERDGGWFASERNRATEWMRGRDNPTCSGCRLKHICDKPTTQYLARYGTDELKPIAGEPFETDALAFQYESKGSQHGNA